MQLDNRIPPLALWAACVALAVASARWLNPWDIAVPGHRFVAATLLLLGVAIAAAGVVEFRRHKTTVNPMEPGRASAVVASGVYRFSRNPMYLGMALAMLGVVFWWPSVAGGIVVLLFCLYIDRFQIRPEEKVLLGLFGDDYSAYLSRVRRWI